MSACENSFARCCRRDSAATSASTDIALISTAIEDLALRTHRGGVHRAVADFFAIEMARHRLQKLIALPPLKWTRQLLHDLQLLVAKRDHSDNSFTTASMTTRNCSSGWLEQALRPQLGITRRLEGKALRLRQAHKNIR
jgi:hypothetical protein